MLHRPWQFSLKHLFAIMLALCLLLVTWQTAGLRGVVVFVLVLGLALGALSSINGSKLFFWLGVWLFFSSGALLFLDAISPRGSGNGQMAVQSNFTITDATTGEPISDATIWIRDTRSTLWMRDTSSTSARELVPAVPIPPAERGVKGATGPNGSVSLVIEFPCSQNFSLLKKTGRLYITPEFWIQVEAPGYERVLVPMEEILGARIFDMKTLPLPAMHIALEPTPAEPLEEAP